MRMNMSSVSATRPSVEFSTGTTPKSTWPRLTSSNTAAMLPTPHELDRLAEALDGGEVAETVLRPEVGDLEHLLQGPRAAHDLAEDGPDRHVVERPFVLVVDLQDVLEHFFFAGRREDFAALIVLDLADLRGEAGPLVDQFQDLQVELVDLRRAEYAGSCDVRDAAVLLAVVTVALGFRAPCQVSSQEGARMARVQCRN